MATQDRPLSGRQIDRRVLALAVPALGALAADPLLSLVDTAFVARLGTVALGALGVDTAIFSFAFFAFNFLAYATTPMVARRIAASDRLGAGRVIVQAMSLAALLGLLSATVLIVGAEWFVRAMQAGPELVDPAVSYLRIRALAAPAMLIVTAGHGAYRGLQDTRTPLGITLVVNLINLVLDPILIFGVGWGIEGAAIATVTAQIVGAAWFAALLFRMGRRQGWSFARPSLSELAPILGTGGILTVRTFFIVATLTAASAVAASLSPATVAAHQVVAQTWLLLALVVDSLSIAAQAMVADEIGRGDRAAARAISRRLIGWGLVAGLFLLVVLLAGRGLLASVFATEPAVREMIIAAVVVAALMQPVSSVVFVLDGIYMGLLQVRYLGYSTAVGALAAAPLLWAASSGRWGLTGVWWAIVALVTGRLIVLSAAYPRAFAAAR